MDDVPQTGVPFEPPARLPLTALRWKPWQVVALVAWAAALNIGQALAIRGLNIAGLPGEVPHFIRAVVVFAFYGAIVAPVIISARRQGVRFSEAVGLRPAPVLTVFGLAIVAVLAARFGAIVWALVMQALHLRIPGGVPDISRLFGTSPFGIALTVVVAVFVGPFAEEVVFRGVAFAQLERWQGTASAVFGSSLLFGLLHVNAVELVPLVIAGALFAWVFYATRSLWTSVTAHALFNLMSIVALYSLKAAVR